MSSMNAKPAKKKNKKNKKGGGSSISVPSMDVLVNKYGKHLQPGENVRFTLIKGPQINRIESKDPVNQKAQKEYFPLIAKFGNSVMKPNLNQEPWSKAHLYQEDVPKADIDSDEEEEEAKAILANSKRKWKRNKRKDVPKRHWVLQEKAEFFETIAAKKNNKKRRADGASAAVAHNPLKGKISSRYEGIAEHNPSHFIIMQAPPSSAMNGSHSNTDSTDMHDDHEDVDGYPSNPKTNIQVTLCPNPPNVYINFSQPAVRKTLTMAEAEQAIQDQRAHMSRYMMHDGKDSNGLTAMNKRLPPVSSSKKRLMAKAAKSGGGAAAASDDAAADDIMADVAFRDRKGVGGASRRELLTSLGDEMTKVDDEGVIGGANDEEFGGKRQFGRFKNPAAGAPQGDGDGGANAADDGGGKTKGNAGMAMDDGFYQRDVQAEYEELDFDVNEQFDDDDVDHGETEVMEDSNFSQDNDDNDDFEEEGDNSNEAISGIEGLASTAGFKAMLAKARAPADSTTAEGSANPGDHSKKDEKDSSNASGSKKSDHLSKIESAASRFNEESKERATRKVDTSTTNEAQRDANGNRVITLEAVRKEVWLHHGAIEIKRLMKLFDVSNKSNKGAKSDKARRDKFRGIILELCIMKDDPIKGKMLVLKQHYSNMGS